MGFKQLSGYASTKSALTGLTKSFATEMSKYNVRANVGTLVLQTSYFKKFKSKKNCTIDFIKDTHESLKEPEEIASLIVFYFQKNPHT